MSNKISVDDEQILLKDGRKMLVRDAEVEDVGAVAAVHPLPRGIEGPEGPYRLYYSIKSWLYVACPESGICTGWVEGELAGFVFYTGDIKKLKRFVVSPGNILRLTGALLSGKFGFNLLMWVNFLRWGLQHFRLPQAKVKAGDYEIPEELKAWIGTVHTVDKFRRLGVASALLSRAEQRISSYGASQVALWVAEDNEPAIALYEKVGYRKTILVPRIKENCWLMVKQLRE